MRIRSQVTEAAATTRVRTVSALHVGAVRSSHEGVVRYWGGVGCVVGRVLHLDGVDAGAPAVHGHYGRCGTTTKQSTTLWDEGHSFLKTFVTEKIFNNICKSSQS